MKKRIYSIVMVAIASVTSAKTEQIINENIENKIETKELVNDLSKKEIEKKLLKDFVDNYI